MPMNIIIHIGTILHVFVSWCLPLSLLHLHPSQHRRCMGRGASTVSQPHHPAQKPPTTGTCDHTAFALWLVQRKWAVRVKYTSLKTYYERRVWNISCIIFMLVICWKDNNLDILRSTMLKWISLVLFHLFHWATRTFKDIALISDSQSSSIGQCRSKQCATICFKTFFKTEGARTTIWPSNPSTRPIPREKHNSNRHMHLRVRCSTVSNSQDVEAT